MTTNYSLNVAQLGRESTAGTAVAATSIWRGLFAFPEDARTRIMGEEEIGLLVPAERSYDVEYGVTLGQPATPATYEQLPHVFEAGIMEATPSGAGPYSRVYSFPVGATFNTIQTYTIRGGNANGASDFRVIPYAFVTEFELAGKSKEAWTIAATWMGQRLNSGAVTPALGLQAVREMIFANTLLYIDDSGGTIGTTQVAGVIRGFSMRVKTGVKPVQPGDGNLYYVNHWFDRASIEFTLTLALQTGASSAVADERAAYDSDAIRLIRLQTPGASGRDFVIDMAAKYSKVNPYEKGDDGSTHVRFEGRATYSDTDSLFCEMTVDNGIATY